MVDRQPHPEPTNRNTVPNEHADLDSDRGSVVDTDPDTHAFTYAVYHTDTNPFAYRDTYCYSHKHAYPHADIYADVHAYAQCDEHRYTDSTGDGAISNRNRFIHAHANHHAHSDSNQHAFTYTHANADRHANPHTIANGYLRRPPNESERATGPSR